MLQHHLLFLLLNRMVERRKLLGEFIVALHELSSSVDKVEMAVCAGN